MKYIYTFKKNEDGFCLRKITCPDVFIHQVLAQDEDYIAIHANVMDEHLLRREDLLKMACATKQEV